MRCFRDAQDHDKESSWVSKQTFIFSRIILMNSYALLLLGGQVGANVVFYGGYASADAAFAAAVGTGKPWQYQVVQCYGPVTGNPPGPVPPVGVFPGNWLAVCSGFAANGDPIFVAYGGFDSEAAANAWTALAGVPGAYSVGLVNNPL